MTDREEALIRATAAVVGKRLAATQEAVRNLKPGAQYVQFPAPQVEVAAPVVQVTNELTSPAPLVTVQVDMAPIAAALDRMTEATISTHDVLSQLLQVLANLPVPIVKPIVRVRPAQVNVAAPQVTVEAPEPIPASPPPTPRPFRTLHIRHDDGSESTVTEE